MTVLLFGASTSAESLLRGVGPGEARRWVRRCRRTLQLAPFVIVFALETSLAKYAAEMSEPRESLYFSSALPTTRRPVMSARERGAMTIARIVIAMMSSGRVKPSSPRARVVARFIVPASR